MVKWLVIWSGNTNDFAFYIYFHLTAVWTGSGATFTAGNHTVMDKSMKHPCLALTWFPPRLLCFYTVVTLFQSKLSASWCCNGWDMNFSELMSEFQYCQITQ